MRGGMKNIGWKYYVVSENMGDVFDFEEKFGIAALSLDNSIKVDTSLVLVTLYHGEIVDPVLHLPRVWVRGDECWRNPKAGDEPVFKLLKKFGYIS